ncbi:methyltransferase [Tropicibacter sp. S64]|uniref:methyltransferase n=1 Tax=Tropicibacter sp. S64 TaxID=3415122 RepID=UPI003C7EA87E
MALSRPAHWLARLVARPSLQALAERLPIASAMARRDGAAIFDLMQGFVAAQVLAALIELHILERLLEQEMTADGLALSRGIAPDRMAQLLQAGVALGLLRQRRGGRYGLARRGAAILGVPGLPAMIRHNRAFYADMADPVAVLRGEGDTHLQRFWPYVFGAGVAIGAEEAESYSDLMAQSQVLVARDTLRMVSLRGVSHLMDVGGGSGVFLAAALRAQGRLRATLVDLPEVMPSAKARLAGQGLGGRVTLAPGDFRTDALPQGADAVSLVRVLYDHDDDTVRGLLARVREALPVGGRLIVSEPMSGGPRPDPATDVYFAFYTMAMGTGRVRAPARIAALCEEAGFGQIRVPRAPRPFITRAVVAVRLA